MDSIKRNVNYEKTVSDNWLISFEQGYKLLKTTL